MFNCYCTTAEAFTRQMVDAETAQKCKVIKTLHTEHNKNLLQKLVKQIETGIEGELYHCLFLTYFGMSVRQFQTNLQRLTTTKNYLTSPSDHQYFAICYVLRLLFISFASHLSNNTRC